MDEATRQLLIAEARLAREHAHVPISGFKVGAALITDDGKIYRGCNVEISNMHSICAERCALVKALSDGCRTFRAIAVIADSEYPLTPCGQCRQALNDFGSDWHIVMATTRSNATLERTVGELFPSPFIWVRGA